LVFGDHDPGIRVAVDTQASFSRQKRMGGDKLCMVIDPYLLVIVTNGDVLSHMGVRYRVAVGVEGDQAVSADQPGLDRSRIKGDLGERQKMRSFFLSFFNRSLAGGCDKAIDALKPAFTTPVQIRHIDKGGSDKKIVVYKTDQPFGLALGLWTIRPAGSGHEPVVGGKIKKWLLVADLTAASCMTA